MRIAYVSIYYSVPGGPGRLDVPFRLDCRFLDLEGSITKLERRMKKAELSQDRFWDKIWHGNIFWRTYGKISRFSHFATTYPGEKNKPSGPVVRIEKSVRREVRRMLREPISKTKLEVGGLCSSDPFRTPRTHEVSELYDLVGTENRFDFYTVEEKTT